MLVAMTTLLIIVMLTAGHTTHGFTLPDLAMTKEAVGQPRAGREDAMRVVITRDGSIYFRNVKIQPSDLPGLVRRAVENGAERRVYLAVDARAQYGDAKVVYDLIAEGGVRDICLVTEKIAPHK